MARKGPVSERAASGETERIYHEIRQSLRVTGVNLIFRTWAANEPFLSAMWEELQPNVETRAFEEAADRIRAEAVRAALRLDRLGAWEACDLGESQRWQLRRALDLYHYVNPKLLVLACAVGRALRGEAVGGAGGSTERILRGPPAGMPPMEMVAERPDDRRLRRLFRDIVHTLGLSHINSDYRTMALWPDYLEEAWSRLSPIVRAGEYRSEAFALRQSAMQLARGLPFPVELPRDVLERMGEDPDELLETTEKFEHLLPPLILNVALCAVDASADPQQLVESPFPAPSAPAPFTEEIHP